MSRGFRIWDKQTKSYEWDREFVLDSSGELMELCSNHNGTWEYHSVDTDQFVIEFETGLKDKNGKEIYEGDIVRVCHNRYGKPNKKGDRQLVEEIFNCIVVWDTYKFRFEYQFAERASQIYDWDDFKTHRFHDVTKIEIVGNIHENPELLEGKK